ncbi:mechanosensitive ion channel [archaeon]|jgi:small-conductance mechanosensitive channel|nr:mechanosensitive ion channel [archaeon]MBT6697869.1 mechanosensitive ion channel [archaeon]
MGILTIFTFLIEKFIDAVGIFVIGFTLAVIIKGFTRKILQYVKLNKYANLAGITMDLETDIANILSYALYALTLLWLVKTIQIARFTLLIITFITVLLIGFTLISHSKDLPLNLFGYYKLRKNKIFRKGKFIQTKQIDGAVVKTSLTQTIIKTKNGDIFYVPNYAFFGK